MPLSFTGQNASRWTIEKIAVIGPGIVGMPMAAMLAHARVVEGGGHAAAVTVIQRDSPSSGWKVGAINEGRSPIGGVEPQLDRIVGESVAAGLLRATHDAGEAADADVILVCVQTDKTGFAPDYGPLMASLDAVAEALRHRPAGNIPLVVFESTLAPSSMATVIRDHFARYGLLDGRDVLLGNSPNRVMPGRLVERVAASDKIVAGLHPLTPRLIRRLYAHIVTGGTLLETNAMTAEVVKTLENAYRDVRIAYSTEIVRYCDRHDLDFYAVRDEVNRRLAQPDEASANPTAVPSGGILGPDRGSRRALSAEGRHPAVVASKRGRAGHVAEPDPRLACDQRCVTRRDPPACRARIRRRGWAGGRHGRGLSVRLRGHTQLAQLLAGAPAD